MELAVIDQNLKSVGKVQLAKETEEKVNKAVLYYGVKAFRTNKRHGTAKVQTRGEVSRTGKKAYRQKGTGNARHGSRRAPIFVGGGKAHGPQPRNFSEKVNKKFKAKCYQEIFKFLIQNGTLKVLSGLAFDKPSTKSADAFLKGLKFSKALIILPEADEYLNTALSFRNLKDVKVLSANNLNVFDLLKYENVVVLQETFEKLKERYSL